MKDNFWASSHAFHLRNLYAWRTYSWLRNSPDYWKHWASSMHACKRCLKHMRAEG